jgi:TfoX/Sxy family transcriptional regulator of competence genes
MAYNREIEARIGQIVSGWKHIVRKNMFGGVCHLLKGNMFCGVYKDSLILRLGEDRAKSALTLPSVRPFDIMGRPMKGWVMVEGTGFQTDEDLKEWLTKAKEFVSHLPPK